MLRRGKEVKSLHDSINYIKIKEKEKMIKFIELVTKELEKVYPDAEIQVIESQKNSIKKSNLLIMGDRGITPSITLEPYYDMYIFGMKIDKVLEKIISDYEKHSMNIDAMSSIARIVEDFEQVRNFIFIRTINTELNKDFLKDIPSISLFDLSGIFWINVEDVIEGASITVTNALLKSWGIKKEELFEIALKNIKMIKSFTSISDILRNTVEPFTFPDILYILSNIYYNYGNGYIMDKECLKEIGNKFKSDYFILPSSIHEFIISPISRDKCDELKRMVQEINVIEVGPIDFLSNNVYWYDWKKGELSMC